MHSAAQIRKNRYFFGLGTVGRDMAYTIVSLYLMFYYTDILRLSNTAIWWVTAFMFSFRVFDALNDPIMGTIVDNTRTRWGKFKPFILLGALTSGVLTVILFTDFGLQETGTIALFSIVYLFWGISFTVNDISYWSMMPTLSKDQKEREKIGSIARICANVGLFSVVVGITPITNALGLALGDMKSAYTVFALGIVVLLWGFQLFTLIGVKEEKIETEPEKTDLRGMLKALFKNDQLLVTAVAMALFMMGYNITTVFGLHYFKYIFGDESMYSIFALVLGVAQLTALSVFPLFSKKYTRKQLYKYSTILVIVGYLIFFFSPQSIVYIIIAGLCIFFAQAFIQLLMLVFLADTIEYGEWKLGKRNESVSFAVQPFINKMGGAVASGFLGVTVILSGMNMAISAADMTPEGILLVKSVMLLVPLVLITVSFIIYSKKFKIDKDFYEKIIKEIEMKKKV